MPTRHTGLDHYKLLLIVLVVFGHLIEPAISLHAVKPIYNFIYLFHIPAFVFLAGMFTRPGYIWRRTLHLLILLIVFQCLYYLYLPSIDMPLNGGVLRPYWILWFLLSLIFWTLCAPLIRKYPWPLTFALLMALVAGTVDKMGYTLSLARTFYFFPFFVAGLCYGDKIIALIGDKKIWGLTGMLACVVAIAFLQPLDERLLYGSHSFADFDQSLPEGIAVRLGLYALSALAVFSFIPLMPQKEGLAATLGAGTLAVFILHGFIVLPLNPFMLEWFTQNVFLGFAIAAVLTLLIVFVLAQPIVTKLLNMPARILQKAGLR